MGGGRPGVDTEHRVHSNQPGQVSDETKLFGIIGSEIVVGADDRVTVGADAGGYQPIGRVNVQAIRHQHVQQADPARASGPASPTAYDDRAVATDGGGAAAAQADPARASGPASPTAYDDRAVATDGGGAAAAQADHAGASGPAEGLHAGGGGACADNNRAVGAGTGGGPVRATRQVTQPNHAGAGGPAKGLIFAGRADVL